MGYLYGKPGKFAAIFAGVSAVLLLGGLLACYFALLAKEQDLQEKNIQAKDCHSIGDEIWEYSCNKKICQKGTNGCHNVVSTCYAINVTLQYSAPDANNTPQTYQFMYVDKQYDLPTEDSAEAELPYLSAGKKFSCYYSKADHSIAKVGSISTTPGIIGVTVCAVFMFIFLVLMTAGIVLVWMGISH